MLDSLLHLLRHKETHRHTETHKRHGLVSNNTAKLECVYKASVLHGFNITWKFPTANNSFQHDKRCKMKQSCAGIRQAIFLSVKTAEFDTD